MWAYLTQYLWIILVVKWVVLPLKLDLASAPPVTFIGSEILILATYFALTWIAKLLSKKKKPKIKKVRN